ncbi:lysine--tRNA ligase [Candidatus Parcubacteria bacterium]|nr:lysine--tRNA ligase [Candidatus Parcubacteria bacterium]
MAEPIENLRRIRIEKLEKLRQRGVDPYPSKFEGRMEIETASKKKLGSKVKVAGRIVGWRGHGRLIFADLKDESGQLQLCFKQDELPSEKFKLLELFDLGDFLGVEGSLFKTKAGELTVLVSDFQLLTKAVRPLPSTWHGLKDVEERYRKRYLDLLMNPPVRKVFETRTKILTLLREYLDEHGFVEVETPVLQPIYGGAAARPFTTHLNALDSDFYLRISDELYLKRLIVGGFEKIYEVSKDFRNEGIDRQHSPEFTQVEFYWAYADYHDLMEFSEKMLSHVVKEVCGSLQIEFEGQKLSFKSPWPRVTYRDLVLEHSGIDIDKAQTEKELKEAISDKGLKLDLSGVVGYGPLVDILYKEYCRPKIIQPTFLIDHPAELMPLAKRKTENSSRIESVQLLVSGYEVFKAYSELNDPQDQKVRWEEQEGLAKKGLAEHEVLDEDYIEALEYGMPPTAGWGMGIDRLTAILTDQHTIRDVILFPLMRPRG